MLSLATIVEDNILHTSQDELYRIISSAEQELRRRKE